MGGGGGGKGSESGDMQSMHSSTENAQHRCKVCNVMSAVWSAGLAQIGLKKKKNFVCSRPCVVVSACGLERNDG